jgi:hypothetical protein
VPVHVECKINQRREVVIQQCKERKLYVKAVKRKEVTQIYVHVYGFVDKLHLRGFKN